MGAQLGVVYLFHQRVKCTVKAVSLLSHTRFLSRKIMECYGYGMTCMIYMTWGRECGCGDENKTRNRFYERILNTKSFFCCCCCCWSDAKEFTTWENQSTEGKCCMAYTHRDRVRRGYYWSYPKVKRIYCPQMSSDINQRFSISVCSFESIKCKWPAAHSFPDAVFWQIYCHFWIATRYSMNVLPTIVCTDNYTMVTGDWLRA